jgi:hypothetical protein
MSDNNRGGNGQQQRRNIYSNAEMSSYDSHFTALKYRFMNGFGVVDFAFIDPNFIGKQGNQIKKGDKVYDHENNASFYVTAANAIVMKKGLQAFRGAIEAEQQEEELVDQLRSIRFPFHATGGKEKVVTFYAPGTAKVKSNKIPVDTENKFLLQVETFDKEGNAVKACHVMQTSTIEFTYTKASESEGAEDIIHHDMDLFEAFLDSVILLNTGVLKQGTQMGMPSGGSSGGQSTGRRNQPQPSIDDEDDDEEEVGNSKPSGGKKPAAKTVKALNLDEEFDDVPQ